MHILEIRFLRERFPDTDTYPFGMPLIRNTGSITLTSPVTFFTGENGSGKTTILKALARACGIYLWGQSDRVRYRPSATETRLHNYMRVVWNGASVPGSFFDSEVFNNFARILDDWAESDPGVLRYFGGESLMSKSHGQRNMTFFKNRFARPGVYILDEPETAFSPRSQIEFLDIMASCVAGFGAQFIIASHSPILLAAPGATILSIDDGSISTVPYESTDYFTVYRDFLNGRRRD